MTKTICVLLIALSLLAGCNPVPDLEPGAPLTLATFTENEVAVELALEVDATGQVYLAATFTPAGGFHLYSKDLPRDGQAGLGRPTLLELAPDSRLLVSGILAESVAVMPEPGPEGLPLYPAGPVTLRLPVLLPEGDGWSEETAIITYMACSDYLCLPPVIGKAVIVRIPGSGLLVP